MRATSSPRCPNFLFVVSPLPLLLPWLLVCLAWAMLLFAISTNHASFFNHDYLLRSSHLPWGVAFLLFLLGWQIMIAAMMLPSSFSAFISLARKSFSWCQIWRRQLSFLFGYAVVWNGFALAAFLGDTGLHALVNRWPWLALHSWLIGMIVLMLAGLFQLLPPKRRYLKQCCAPSARGMVRSGKRETTWRLGLRYGRACLGSCWAIMLVMVALGMQNLAWLALLAVLMLIEKEFPGGTRLRPWIGALFLCLALLNVAWPLVPGI